MLSSSVVITTFNECESIEHVYRELADVLNSMDGETEIVFVDDASTDKTADIIRSITREDNRVRSYSLSENSCKAGALKVGCNEAKGDAVVIIDGDGQDDPQDIPRLLKVIEDGADAAWGWRWQRCHPNSKQLSSWAINALANKMLDSHFRDTNASLKAIRKEALESLSLEGGMVRFLPHQLFKRGYEVLEVPVNHRERFGGSSSFGMLNRVSTIGDLIAIYRGRIPTTSTVPSYFKLTS